MTTLAKIEQWDEAEPLSIELRPGTYLVCDPCYVLDGLVQQQAEEKSWDGDVRKRVHLVFELPDGPASLVQWPTLVGDSCFPFEHHALEDGGYEPPGFALSVDSGCLVVVDKRLTTASSSLMQIAEVVLKEPAILSVDDLANLKVNCRDEPVCYAMVNDLEGGFDEEVDEVDTRRIR